MNVLIGLVLGVTAGLLDVLPMRKMGVPRFSMYYVFAQWVLIGLLIPQLDLGFPAVVNGMVITVLGMIPVMIIAYHRNRKRVPMILVYAILLGAAMGWASSVLSY